MNLPTSNQSVQSGLRHIVMWTLKDEAEGQSRHDNMRKARDILLQFVNLVPGILVFEVGIKTEGQDCTSDLILNSVFKDEASLKAYQNHPDHLAIEAQFFGENVQSMLKLGRAQGVAIAAALSRDIPFTEYAPKKVKMSITGSGNASKEQVAKMLQTILNTKDLPVSTDATDGLATALCHHFQGGKQSTGKSYKGWDAFVKQNPDRKK